MKVFSPKCSLQRTSVSGHTGPGSTSVRSDLIACLRHSISSQWKSRTVTSTRCTHWRSNLGTLWLLRLSDSRSRLRLPSCPRLSLTISCLQVYKSASLSSCWLASITCRKMASSMLTAPQLWAMSSWWSKAAIHTLKVKIPTRLTFSIVTQNSIKTKSTSGFSSLLKTWSLTLNLKTPLNSSAL